MVSSRASGSRSNRTSRSRVAGSGGEDASARACACANGLGMLRLPEAVRLSEIRCVGRFAPARPRTRAPAYPAHPRASHQIESSSRHPMPMPIRRALVPFLAIVLAAPLGAQSAVPMPAFDPSSIDRKFGACQDFFMFANNGWIERNPIPPAFSSWGAFNELTERNTLVLKGILD